MTQPTHSPTLFDHQSRSLFSTLVAPKTLSALLRVLFVVVGLFSLSLSFRKEAFVTDHPLSEDGYYAFTVARNIALGKGITIDGAQLTNGFQPLFTFLTVPAFWLVGEDKLLPIRIIIGLHLLFHLGAAWLIGSILREFLASLYPSADAAKIEFASWFASVAYASSIFLFFQHYNGLETGFTLFMIALAWRCFQRLELEKTSHLFALGALLGIVVLTRIDEVFLAIYASFFAFFFVQNASWLERFKRFFIVGATSFAVSSPWWAYNYFAFGSLMPSGAKAQQSWELSGERFAKAIDALQQVLLPYFYTGRFGNLAFFVLKIAVLSAFLFFAFKALPKTKLNANDVAGKTMWFGALIFLTGMTFVIWYALSSFAAYFYPRYFSPLALISAALLGHLGFVFIERRETLASIATFGFASLLSVSLCVAILFLHQRRVFLGNPFYDEQVGLVRKHVPPTELVGAGQSGNLGYFCDNAVNLDGKVNSEALKYQRNMRDYLEKRNIRWFCDWSSYAKRYLGETPEAYGWKIHAQQGGFILYHRD